MAFITVSPSKPEISTLGFTGTPLIVTVPASTMAVPVVVKFHTGHSMASPIGFTGTTFQEYVVP